MENKRHQEDQPEVLPMNNDENQPEITQEYLSCKQVAKLLGLSHQFVLRKFGDYPGVIDLSPHLVKRGKARRRILRIPRIVLAKFLAEHRVR